MKRSVSAGVVVALTSIYVLACVSGCASESSNRRTIEEEIEAHIRVRWLFRNREVLAMCVELQRMRQEFAIDALMRMAVTEDTPCNLRTIVLCRMLFKDSEGGRMREPLVGSPWFLGDTNSDDWPLEPIHIWKGVPFMITWGYVLSGIAESAPQYLVYCIQNGVWNDEAFGIPARDQLKAIAEDFIEMGPWRRPLDGREQKFIRAQVSDVPSR
jgi:hypothetical protein